MFKKIDHLSIAAEKQTPEAYVTAVKCHYIFKTITMLTVAILAYLLDATELLSNVINKSSLI